MLRWPVVEAMEVCLPSHSHLTNIHCTTHPTHRCRGTSLDHGIDVCLVSVAVPQVLRKANTAQVSVSEWEGNQLVERCTFGQYCFGFVCLCNKKMMMMSQLTPASETWAFKVHDETRAANPMLPPSTVDSGLVGAAVTRPLHSTQLNPRAALTSKPGQSRDAGGCRLSWVLG